jgi:hypothetical protein
LRGGPLFESPCDLFQSKSDCDVIGKSKKESNVGGCIWDAESNACIDQDDAQALNEECEMFASESDCDNGNGCTWEAGSDACMGPESDDAQPLKGECEMFETETECTEDSGDGCDWDADANLCMGSVLNEECEMFESESDCLQESMGGSMGCFWEVNEAVCTSSDTLPLNEECDMFASEIDCENGNGCIWNAEVDSCMGSDAPPVNDQCSLFGSENDCDCGDGCIWDAAADFCIDSDILHLDEECEIFESESKCDNGDGCIWDAEVDSCIDTDAQALNEECEMFASESDCIEERMGGNMGCFWDATEAVCMGENAAPLDDMDGSIPDGMFDSKSHCKKYHTLVSCFDHMECVWDRVSKTNYECINNLEEAPQSGTNCMWDEGGELCWSLHGLSSDEPFDQCDMYESQQRCERHHSSSSGSKSGMSGGAQFGIAVLVIGVAVAGGSIARKAGIKCQSPVVYHQVTQTVLTELRNPLVMTPEHTSQA